MPQVVNPLTALARQPIRAHVPPSPSTISSITLKPNFSYSLIDSRVVASNQSGNPSFACPRLILAHQRRTQPLASGIRLVRLWGRGWGVETGIDMGEERKGKVKVKVKVPLPPAVNFEGGSIADWTFAVCGLSKGGALPSPVRCVLRRTSLRPGRVPMKFKYAV